MHPVEFTPERLRVELPIQQALARRTTQQSYLVSWLLGEDAKLYLALNVRPAAAVVGKPFVLVSLTERLQLESDTAKALHAYFCARVHPGNHLNVRVDTLRQRLWPDADVPDGTARRRRKAAQDALRELAALSGWEVEKSHFGSRLREAAGTASSRRTACVITRTLPCHIANAAAPRKPGNSRLLG